MWATSGDAESVGAEKAIAQAITNMWYNGELDLFPSNDYGLDNPDFSNFESFGHYTQVVWAGSKQVGCEAKYCPPGTMVQGMGAWFSVCNYWPAGKSALAPLLNTYANTGDRQHGWPVWQECVAPSGRGYRFGVN